MSKMQKWIYLIATAIIASAASSLVYAQQENTPPHAATTIPPSARYEIIQSQLAAKWTFKLDRVCGNIAQLAQDKNENLIWENMLVIDLPKCSADGKVRYQAFTSGLAAKHTFLMNLDTGKTWAITRFGANENEYTAWRPFKE